MRKYVLDLDVVANEHLREDYVLLKLTDSRQPLPPMQPGQFVEIRVDNSATTLLRRPISINYVDKERNELWLLIHEVGDGTRALGRLQCGSRVNVMLPLGKGFSLYAGQAPRRMLLIGGGVGTAPLLYLGRQLLELGHRPTFLLGGRSAKDLLQLDQFEQIGRVFTTTEDGSLGEKGYVTQHSLLTREQFDSIATCGPKPMMVSVARYAQSANTPCEVSLENRMACGVGACLCCVEKNAEGHNVCVCKDGPVFNINQLQWQI